MADWPLLADTSFADTVGEDAAASSGLRVITTLNAKGSWVQAVAATQQEAHWLLVKVIDANHIADYLLDIGVGAAGSEQVIVANLTASQRSGRVDGSTFLVPVAIPAGSRVAARGQSSLASECRVLITLLTGGWQQSSPLGVVDTYGANTADSGGVSVDPGGVAHTKGAWSEITSATAGRIRWLVLGFGNQANSARTSCKWLVDIGVGAPGSEVVVLPDLGLGSGGTGPTLTPIHICLPFTIPAGSRVAARAQCDIIDATDRTFDVILYGAG